MFVGIGFTTTAVLVFLLVCERQANAKREDGGEGKGERQREMQPDELRRGRTLNFVHI